MVEEPLRFLADMNLSPLTIETLQQVGWDIIRVSSLLSPSAADSEILILARDEGRIIITHDLDFSALLALSGYDRPSLITLRLGNTDPDLVAHRLIQILPHIESALREGCAVTADETTLRIRKLPIWLGNGN